MSKLYKKGCILSLLMLISISTLFAQQSVTGRVTDTNGALAGVTVVVPGTNRSTQTDAQGSFSIQAARGEKLRFSTVGYVAQEVEVTGLTVNVTLQEDAGALDEVVVTAMGIKKERKALGYAFQDVSGQTLLDAREVNVTNALAGKVSNLQVVKGSGGPGASSKIILRGFNSLVGDNQPLIVVDGVPMDNFVGAQNNDFWNPTADFGNGLGDINPDDIESMSVLKGGAASALYGSRASNGAILITTKSGKKNDGVGVTYSSTLGFQTLFITPERQTAFGQGSEGTYDRFSGLSWGPKIEGQVVPTWNGDQPLSYHDNMANFFQTGVNNVQNITFSQSVGKTNVYLSGTYSNDNSVIPNSSLKRLNLMSRVTTTYGKSERLSTDVKVQYMNNNASNRPVGGANSGNYYSQVLLFPNSLDLSQFKEGMDVLGAQQTWYLEQGGVNPYWASYNKLNNDIRNRYLLNAVVKYKFTDWLESDVRLGSDNYNTQYEGKTYTGNQVLQNSYSAGQEKFYENNYIISLTAKKDNIFGDWNGAASLFGQIMQQERNGLRNTAQQLNVPNLFTFGNSVGNPGIDQSFSKKQINSLFANVDLDYKNIWFLTLTGRQDWTSSLRPGNNSYFYPSVSTSLIVSDLLANRPTWLSFTKVRASYAQTGRDMNPYQLYNTYNIGRDPNGNTTASKLGTLFNPDVVNELQKSFEAGLEAKFFNQRLGVDFTYYKTNSTNQLIMLPLNNLSGYNNFMANAGNIQNKGFEVLLNASILANPEKLRWNVTLNLSRNENTIEELTDGITQYGLGGYDNLSVFAETGKEYGAIYGRRYLRVTDENSPYFGKKILSANGLPQEESGSFYLGSQVPRFLTGINNTFSYKNVGLSFQVDGRFGGKIFSGTNLSMQANGSHVNTVVNGERGNFVVDGVIDNNGTFEQSTVEVTPQNYWNKITGVNNLGINEENIYKADNIRLRTVQLSYSLPRSVFTNSNFIRNARIGVTVNNVWMIKSYANGVDPEAVYATNSNAIGFEYLNFPSSRNFVFNLSVGF